MLNNIHDSVGSMVQAGRDVSIVSSRDTAVIGSGVQAGRDALIQAGRDVNILPGAVTSFEASSKSSSGIGFGGSLSLEKVDLFAGSKEVKAKNTVTTHTDTGSQLSAGNNLQISANNNINMMTGKLAAGNDLLLNAGNNINVLQGSDRAEAERYTSEVKVGLTLKVEQNLTSNVKKAYDATKQAVESKDLVSGANSGIAAGKQVADVLDSKASASLTLGASSASSSASSSSNMAVLPELVAGHDMTLAAGKDITLEGAQMVAGNDMLLAAGRDLNIKAAVSTTSSDQESHSASVGVGVAANVGLQSAPSAGYTLSAEFANSGQEANTTTHQNSKILAGGTLTTLSGQDTKVVGGNLTAKDIDMTVGRDLLVSSVQDYGSASGHSTKVGGSVTVGFGASVDVNPPSGKATGSLGVTNSESSSRRVNDQTSIMGTNSVNIYTEKNTHVAGAVIAALNDNLKLDTGTLTYEDMVGKSSSTSTGWGITWSKSFGGEKGGSDKAEDSGGKADQKKDTPNAATDKPTPPQPGATAGKDNTNKKPDAEKMDEYKPKEPLASILALQKTAEDKWTDLKADAQFAPAAFSYQHSESKQTAHATIGNGEIIVRNDPNASLNGLNRDVASAMTEKTTANVNIKLDPMFEYVDAVIAAKDVPFTINEVFRFEHDPGTFLKDAWQNFVNNLPWNTGKKKEDTPPAHSAAQAQSTVQAGK